MQEMVTSEFSENDLVGLLSCLSLFVCTSNGQGDR